MISAYGQHFTRTGVLDPRFHKALLDAFNQRQLGDYTVMLGIGESDVENLRLQARAFVDEAEKWLRENTNR